MPLHKWNKEHLLSEEGRTKSLTAWRYGIGALIGVYLILSPLILGTSGEPVSTINAMAVGIGLLTLSVRVLLTGVSRTNEIVRLGLVGWLIAAPFVLSFEPVASRSAWIAGVLLLATSDLAGLVTAVDRMFRARSRIYRALRLSPERIAGCESSRATATPETLSKQIVERSDQIRKALLANPSKVEVDMCLIGYKSCAADMLLLEGLYEKEYPQAGPIHRCRLKAARHKATDSLSRTRETLPSKTLQSLHLRVSEEDR